MVETKVDVVRPSPLTLSSEEIDEIVAEMAEGRLPPDYLDRCDEAREANVFGHDHKKDRHGKPIEQGIGSENNMTRNCVEAYRRFGKSEPNYTEHLARMEKQLAVCEARRAEASAKRGRR